MPVDCSMTNWFYNSIKAQRRKRGRGVINKVVKGPLGAPGWGCWLWIVSADSREEAWHGLEPTRRCSAVITANIILMAGVTGSGKRHELPGQRGLVTNGAETRSPPLSGCTCVCLCGVHLCGSCTVYSVHHTPSGWLLGVESFNLKTRGGSAAVDLSVYQKWGGRKSSWGLLSAATARPSEGNWR